MKDEILKVRIKAAKDLERRLKSIMESLSKIPSYTGKASFMDKVIRAYQMAKLQKDNLELDWAYRNRDSN